MTHVLGCKNAFHCVSREVAAGSALAAVRLAGAGCSAITPTGTQIPSHILLQHTKRVQGKERLKGKSVSLKNAGRTLCSGLSGHKSIYFGASAKPGPATWKCDLKSLLQPVEFALYPGETPPMLILASFRGKRATAPSGCLCLAVSNSIHGLSLGLPPTKTTCRYFKYENITKN